MLDAVAWAGRALTAKPPLRSCLNGVSRHGHGASLSAPCSGRAFEHAGARGAASIAAAIYRQVPKGKVVPITTNQPCLAGTTICALPLFVVGVSGEHVMKPRIPSDMPCQAKRGCRRRRLVEHLPIRVKSREMERNVWP